MAPTLYPRQKSFSYSDPAGIRRTTRLRFPLARWFNPSYKILTDSHFVQLHDRSLLRRRPPVGTARSSPTFSNLQLAVHGFVYLPAP